MQIKNWNAGDAGCGSLVAGLKRELDTIGAGHHARIVEVTPVVVTAGEADRFLRAEPFDVHTVRIRLLAERHHLLRTHAFQCELQRARNERFLLRPGRQLQVLDRRKQLGQMVVAFSPAGGTLLEQQLASGEGPLGQLRAELEHDAEMEAHRRPEIK